MSRDESRVLRLLACFTLVVIALVASGVGVLMLLAAGLALDPEDLVPPTSYGVPFSIAGASILLAFVVWAHGLIRSLRSTPSAALPWDGNWDELTGEAA